MPLTIMIRGGGDLSSGVAYRLCRAGWRVLITELPQPLAVRRLVAFSQAVYSGKINIEGVEGVLAGSAAEAADLMSAGKIPVLVDPLGASSAWFKPQVIVDGRMTKRISDLHISDARLTIGLGPGFVAGENCHAVIETKRGPFLGRVFWRGTAEPDSGLPDQVGVRQKDRVLHAPSTGKVRAFVEIGSSLEENQPIVEVNGEVLRAPFRGLLRGLIYPGIVVEAGVKVGDIDPRMDPRLCDHISDKALAMGGAVLEAILSVAELRDRLWA
jgi:xanthine dehydrogenase accessory factor